MPNELPEQRPQLGFWRVVSQDVMASIAAMLGAIFLVTAGIMLPKSGAGVAGATALVAILLAGIMAWRVQTVRGRVARAVRMTATLTRNVVMPTAHNQSLRYLTVTYEVGGQTFSTQLLSATNGPHAQAQLGDEISILVDPKNPKFAWLLEQFVT